MIKIPIFSYGSNSIYQLRGRLNNNNLISYPAYSKDYKRIFRGYSHNWKGGVASLLKNKGSITYGNIVFLSENEIKKLDEFEIGYVKEKINCFLHNEELIECLTYISEDNIWKCEPSEQYLVSILLTLNENSDSFFIEKLYSNLSIYGLFNQQKYIEYNDLIESEFSNNFQNLLFFEKKEALVYFSKWTFSNNIFDLNLYSILILVNSKKKKPWIVPYDINKIVLKFEICNINNSKDLFELINEENGLQKINIILKSKNLLGFSRETFELFLDLFKKK
jgi:hypothetical protein